jgi:spore coat polysaccharide biosynthesis predicted glycosyltransferase SpsG
MYPLMSRCDLALTAAGQTLYELAALGRPAVAIEMAANQRPQLAALQQAGTVIAAGAATDQDIADCAATRLAELARDRVSLSRMAAAGRALIDGRGARRVAEAVLARARQAREGEDV